MARSDNFGKRASFKKIIQMPLLPEEVEQVIAWDIDEKERMNLIESLCLDGYSVRLEYDQVSEMWGCQILGQFEVCRNAGFGIFGNAPDMITCLNVALWKAAVRLGDTDWSKSESAPQIKGIY